MVEISNSYQKKTSQECRSSTSYIKPLFLHHGGEVIKKDVSKIQFVEKLAEINRLSKGFILNENEKKIVDSASREEVFALIKQLKDDSSCYEVRECFNKIMPKYDFNYYAGAIFDNIKVFGGIILGGAAGFAASYYFFAFVRDVLYIQDFSGADNYVINFVTAVGAYCADTTEEVATRDLPIIKYDALKCLGEPYTLEHGDSEINV